MAPLRWSPTLLILHVWRNAALGIVFPCHVRRARRIDSAQLRLLLHTRCSRVSAVERRSSVSAADSSEFGLRQLIVRPALGTIPGPVLLGASPDQQHDARWADDDHLESVPDADQHDDVELSGATIVDEPGAPDGYGQVGNGQQHRRHALLQSLPGPDEVEDDVAWHEAAQEVAGLGAQLPQKVNHDGLLSTRRCIVEAVRGERPKGLPRTAQR